MRLGESICFLQCCSPNCCLLYLQNGPAPAIASPYNSICSLGAACNQSRHSTRSPHLVWRVFMHSYKRLSGNVEHSHGEQKSAKEAGYTGPSLTGLFRNGFPFELAEQRSRSRFRDSYPPPPAAELRTPGNLPNLPNRFGDIE
eukprot:1183314-Prorocentrum_minimum.AAC.1